MLKKLIIVALAALMLFGCKKNEENKPVDTTNVSSEINTDTQENENKDKTDKTDKSGQQLSPPEIPTGTKDPSRDPEIPETPDPEKIIKEAINIEDTAGSGVRAEEVTEEQVFATSEENAIKLTMQYMKNNNIYIPTKIELDREDDNFYYIHAYEEMKNSQGVTNVATVGWYNVNKKTSEVTVGHDDIEVGKRPDTYKQ